MDPEHPPSRFVQHNKKGQNFCFAQKYRTSDKQNINIKREKYDFMKFHSKEQIKVNCMAFYLLI